MTEAFKDPKFKELFHDYVREISDPNTREENDLYLRQLEQEGRGSEAVGPGTELVAPEPSFVVKARSKSNRKVFVNICWARKVGNAISESAQGGSRWSVPYSLSKASTVSDSHGQDCKCVDFCVGEETLQGCTNNEQFKRMVIDTALDAAEYRVEEKLDAKSYRILQRKSYYGSTSGPTVQAVKREDGNKADNNRSQFSFSHSHLRESAEPSLSSSPSPASAHADSKRSTAEEEQEEEEPECTFVYRGQADYANAWCDARVKGNNSPSQLVARIMLPRAESAEQLEVEASNSKLHLRMPGVYALEKALPCSVDEDDCKARFDKANKRLEIRFRITSDNYNDPPEVQRDSALQQGDDDNDEEGGMHSNAEETADDYLGSGEDGDGVEERAEEARGSAGLAQSQCGESDEGRCETENERRWREIHALRKDEPGSKDDDDDSDPEAESNQRDEGRVWLRPRVEGGDTFLDLD